MLLVLLFVLIFISITIIALTPREDTNRLRTRGLGCSLIILAASFLLLVDLYQEAQFQQMLVLEWVDSSIKVHTSLLFALDGISILLIVLSSLLAPICILISWDSIKFLFKEFIMFIFLLEVLLMGAFSTLDLLIFFILFEAVLVPVFLIIGMWGVRTKKVRAAYYFFLYTLAGSILMLLSIAVIWAITGTTDYLLLTNIQIATNIQL